MPTARVTTPEDLEAAMGVIELLSSEIGGRRPTSSSERVAAARLAGILRSRGAETELEEFQGYSSFAQPFAILMALAIGPAFVPRSRRLSRVLLAATAAVGLAGEGSLVRAPLSDALASRPSQNVVATIEPRGPVERTICLMAHMDTSRSGLLFHPRLVNLMSRWIVANGLLVVGGAILELFAERSRSARRALAGIRAALLAGLALLAEREIRGVDVPGANDNASGCGVVLALAARVAGEPLASTRVVALITGCEESGTLGARAFRDTHDTTGWMFINFDNVGGPGSVRFLRREGVITKWNADSGLIAVASAVAARRGDLRMAPEDSPAGLTYDSSPIHAAGGRALTISVQDGFIPDLHWPTDVLENIDPDGVRRTLEAGAELVAAIARGDAD